ncbi:MAG TPA: MFS transporter [Anaerolineales bacterium]|nr:MFS transporter [Anaerolineales bacterium]
MADLIKNKQLVYLFLCNFSILFIGFGLFPVLPIYAAEFGASQSFIGMYLAITYIAISIGSILAGQLSEHLPRKTLFIAAGILGAPALFLLGQARSFWQVILLTALVWFVGGIGLSISNVLASVHTTSQTRGRAFSMLALASPLGALIGGLVVGWTVEWGGYSLMFAALTVVWLLWPIVALTRVQDAPECSPAIANAARPLASADRPGSVLFFLLLTIFLASMTVSVGRIGLSLAMKGHQFSAGDVSTANAVGGMVTILVTLLTGNLSDRLGRKRVLALGYVIAVASTATLVSAHELWQFWVVSSLVLASRSVITSMAPAYTTDVLRRRFLGKALPLVGTMNWVSGVIGFAGAGYVLDAFGGRILYGMAALTALIAVVILVVLPASYRARQALPVSEAKEALPTTGD